MGGTPGAIHEWEFRVAVKKERHKGEKCPSMLRGENKVTEKLLMVFVLCECLSNLNIIVSFCASFI